nr:DUF4293 family protein [Blattabacterium cuenoti]
MLYRIQTLYLLISIFIYSVFIYFLSDFLYFNLYLKKIVFIFMIPCLFLSILSFSLFKKKKIQIFLNKINILANTIHVLFLIFSCFQLKLISTIMFILLFFSIYFLYMANKAIRKDIELIDSINRIR